MNDKKNSIKSVEIALSKAISQSVDYPNFQPLMSVIAQLEYLKGILVGEIYDRSRLIEIIIGAYAAREFEDRNMDFANKLYDVELIVDDLKAGKY